MSAGGPPQLGTDDVIRFVDAQHFLSEYASNLSKGQLYVRTKRSFKIGTHVPIKIEAPGVSWSVSLEARVLLSQDGFVGLEALGFKEKVGPTLELLVAELKSGPRTSDAVDEEIDDDPAAKTVIGPPPRPPTDRRPPPRDSTVIEEHPPRAMRSSISPPPAGASVAEFGQDEMTDEHASHFDRTGEAEGPTVDVAGLAELDFGLARVSANGVYRVRDLTELVGKYLSEIRHGSFSAFGGPEGEVGSQVSVTIATERTELVLGAIVVARAGDWVMLQIPNHERIDEFLASRQERVRDALALALPTASAGTAPARAAPSKAPPPRVRTSAAAPPRPSMTPPPRAEPPAPPSPPLPEEKGPARPPRLMGNNVLFERRFDLQAEIDTNLKNGGLFVESTPLPIREHRTLQVCIGTTNTGVAIEADVVFASGGKVGFSVPGFGGLLPLLKQALESPTASIAHASIPPAPASVPPSVPPGPASVPPSVPPGPGSILPGTRSSDGPWGQPSIPPPASTDAQSDSIGTFKGKISRPLHRGDLLDLSMQRIKEPAKLGEAPALLVFEYIARNALKGVLDLRSGDQTLRVWVHKGSIAFIESQPWNEETSLGRILVQSKRVGEPALREALERSRASGRSLGRVLTSLGHIKASALTSALREQTRTKIEPVFSWVSGSFEWSPWTDPPTKADLVLVNGMGTVGRHIRGLFEHTTAHDMEELLENCMLRRIDATELFERLSPKLGFGQKEQRFAELHLDGQQTVSEVVTGSPLGRLASMRMIALGLATEMFALEPSATGTGVRKAPKRSVTDTSGVRALKSRLEADLERLKTQNHFEILGVHWTAHHRSYPSAYAQAIGQYDLRKSPLTSAPDDVKALARQVAKQVEESYKYLSNETNRASYRKKLFTSSEREFTSDMLVKQGEVMLMRGDRVGSIEAFETAVELNASQRNKSLLARAREGRQDL